MDYNKHEPEEHDELPPFTSEVERDELTAPSQAAAQERADQVIANFKADHGGVLTNCACLGYEIAAAIRAAVNEAIEKAAKELEDTGRHEVLAYEVASRLRFHKLPSPSPEKETVGGRESKAVKSDTDATGEAPDG